MSLPSTTLSTIATRPLTDQDPPEASVPLAASPRADCAPVPATQTLTQTADAHASLRRSPTRPAGTSARPAKAPRPPLWIRSAATRRGSAPACHPAQLSEYPLLHILTPAAFKRFCFELNGTRTYLRELDDQAGINLETGALPEFRARARKRSASEMGSVPRDAGSGATPPHGAASSSRELLSGALGAHSQRTRVYRADPATAGTLDAFDTPVTPVPRDADAMESLALGASSLSRYAALAGGPRDPANVEAMADATAGSPPPRLPSPSASPTSAAASLLGSTLHPATRQTSRNALFSESVAPEDPSDGDEVMEQAAAPSALAIGPTTGAMKLVSRNLTGISNSSALLLSPAASSTQPSPTYPAVGLANHGTAAGAGALGGSDARPLPTLDEIVNIIATFDVLPAQLKDYVMLHLLRRCPYPTLRFAANLIGPTLKRDFIALLPAELTYQILAYVDVRTVTRLARVSRTWKKLFDHAEADAAVWKHRLICEGWYNVDEIKQVVEAHRRERETREELRRLELLEKTKSQIVGELQKGLAAIAAGASSSSSSAGASAAVPEPSPKDPAPAQPMDTNDDEPVRVSATDFARSGYPPHLYKHLYQQHYRTRRNWFAGRYKRISFAGHALDVVTCLQFDADKIVSGSDDQTIHVYDAERGTLRRILRGHEGGVWALQYVGHVLVSGSTDRTVRVWDLERGECSHVFAGHTSTVRCLLVVLPAWNEARNRYEPNEPLIVTGSRDATLRVWRLPDPRMDAPHRPAAGAAPHTADAQNPFFRLVLQGHTNSVRAMAGAGNVLVSGSYDATVRIWDLASGECRHVCTGHSEKVYSVGYCHQTGLAASGSMDAKVKVWDVTTGQCLHTLEGHSSLVGLLEISANYLVSAAADATLRVWCPLTGRCLANMVGHQSAITCFHHDARLNRIVSGSDGGAKVWELSSLGYGKDGNRAIFDTANGNVPYRVGDLADARQSPDYFGDGGVEPASPAPDAAPSAGGVAPVPPPATPGVGSGSRAVYGRYVRDLIPDATGVWRVRMDERRLVAAVQKAGGQTWFEVLDFGCEREEEIGTQVELNEQAGVPSTSAFAPAAAP